MGLVFRTLIPIEAVVALPEDPVSEEVFVDGISDLIGKI
jgi:hypothetical protein